ncbi:unnamed protein product [Clonostachys rosea f. rosea IK726]|uniref:Uncharacterized protein n=1 Tax=Clonostachys rosea f. rosea IK726 TaxID=1349383 RepID=A0ACA9TLR2_BIOOC|nr:unnamed protein product [Clonostachys rosea f. rosea IK726]
MSHAMIGRCRCLPWNTRAFTSLGANAMAKNPTLQDNLRRTPTESEEDVVADRSTDDPLPPGKHNTIRMPAGDAQPKPTESEEDVVADRSNEDPLRSK